MTSTSDRRVGLVMASETPPEMIAPLARLGEELGFDELWLPEDCFFNGGIASAGLALAATERVRVGLGVLSGLARHPALLAMEVAALCRAYPGRVEPGIGLGAPAWIEQMGLTPRSQLQAMRETVEAFRVLLSGDEVSREGEVHQLRAIKLTHPPDALPPVRMGVIGPRMLALSGEIADGTIVSVMGTPRYLRWLEEQVAVGRERAGVERPHGITTFTLYRVGRDGTAAKRAVRDVLAFYLFVAPDTPLTEVYGIGDELRDMHARGGDDALALITREMPDAWVDDLTVAGDPDECADRLEALYDAGSDSVCLWPSPAEGTEEVLRLTAAEVLPRLR